MKAALLALALVACGPSSQQKIIQTTFAAIQAADNGFAAFDHQHEIDIAQNGTSREDIDAKLHDYQVKRIEINKLIAAAYKTVAAAALVVNQPNVNSAVQAAAILAQAVVAIGVKP